MADDSTRRTVIVDGVEIDPGKPGEWERAWVAAGYSRPPSISWWAIEVGKRGRGILRFEHPGGELAAQMLHRAAAMTGRFTIKRIEVGGPHG